LQQNGFGTIIEKQKALIPMPLTEYLLKNQSLKPLKLFSMRKLILLTVAVVAISFLASCARGITIEQAANGKARCGKNYLR
jgi:hypothetical protein